MTLADVARLARDCAIAEEDRAIQALEALPVERRARPDADVTIGRKLAANAIKHELTRLFRDLL